MVTAFGSPVNLHTQLHLILALWRRRLGQEQHAHCNVVSRSSRLPLANMTLADCKLQSHWLPCHRYPVHGPKRTFFFNVTWAPKKVGSVSQTLSVLTTNANAGYVTTVPIVLRGNGVSLGPHIQLDAQQRRIRGVCARLQQTRSAV